MHASGAVIIFVKQGLSFTELSTFSLDPYSDCIEVNIFLNNFSSLSFLNVYAPPIRSSPTDGRTDFFSLSVLPSSRNCFILGDFNYHHSSGIQKALPTPVERKYSIGSSLLTSFPSMALTYLLFSIAPLAVAPPLTFPLLPLLSPSLAHGRCFRTWVLITYQFFYLSLSLRSFARTSVLPLASFKKLAGMTLISLSLSFKGILVSFSFLCCYSLHFSGTECSQILSVASNTTLKPGGPLKWKKRQ